MKEPAALLFLQTRPLDTRTFPQHRTLSPKEPWIGRGSRDSNIGTEN